MNKGTLCDAAIQWTYRITQRDGGIDRDILRYRDWLKRASRFVISNDMVESMVKHSTNINKLDGRLWLARLPHEITWIEWDAKHHHKLMNEQFPELSEPQYESHNEHTGFLFIQDPNRESRYMVVVFHDAGQKEDKFAWMIQPICYFVDCEEAIPTHYTCFGAKTLEMGMVNAVNLDLEDSALNGRIVDDLLTPQLTEYSQGLPLGITRRNIAEISDDGTDLLKKDSSRREARWFKEFSKQPFYGKVRAGTEPDYTPALTDPSQYVDHVMSCLKDDAGVVRQLVTLLAMINAVPTIIKAKGGVGYRPVGMNKVRYMSYSEICLKLPKTRPALFIERSMRNALHEYTKRRAHMVRTFWREKSASGRRTCQHAFDHIEKNKYECRNCGRVGWWIKEHQRGDASKGWVRQDYRVVAA
jgi:hypothetical protein